MDALSSGSLFACPSCGNLVTELHELTGFCGTCSKPSTGGNHNVVKQERALAKNADAIEHYLTNGSATTTWQALRLARQDRAICVVCGQPISHASRNVVFCRRYAECRRYSRRYVYLYTERKMTKAEALATVFSELT